MAKRNERPRAAATTRGQDARSERVQAIERQYITEAAFALLGTVTCFASTIALPALAHAMGVM